MLKKKKAVKSNKYRIKKALGCYHERQQSSVSVGNQICRQNETEVIFRTLM